MVKRFSISVVIPNFNGAGLLKENLPFLYQAIHLAGVDFEVIVSDDASSDLSIDFLKSHYPEIKIVESKINRGFASTANAGIFECTKQLVFLLNSDVRITGDYFTPQFKYFEADETFGTMGRIISLDNDSIQDAAKPPYKTGLKIGADKNLIPLTNTNAWLPTLYLSGANALVNREKLIALEGFDEIYSPFYGEDLDLCFRAWKVGWKCFYEHRAICRHPNSVTIKKYNKKKKIKIIVYRNRFIMHDIHLSGWRKVCWNIWLGLQLPVKALLFKKEFLIGFFLYTKLRSRVILSKKRLNALSIKNGISISNEKVYANINHALQSIEHHYV